VVPVLLKTQSQVAEKTPVVEVHRYLTPMMPSLMMCLSSITREPLK
jgi:hypothetical protein